MCSLSRFLFVMAFAWAAVGCGGEMAPPGTCGSSGRSGQTDCSGVTTCNAGQYCDDSGFPTCTPGCTSDANCGPNEFCARPVGEPIGACQSCPVCGNGACESGETASTCAQDCGGGGAVCGNGACEAGESAGNCAVDCGGGIVCGNGACEAGESAANCPVDCGGGVVCGNGACEAGESSTNCPVDCGGGPVCGNTVCEAGESPASCPGDCQDTSLAECYDNCDSYNFFDCFAPGELQQCRDLCTAASMADREQFNSCAGTETVSCNTSCLDFL